MDEKDEERETVDEMNFLGRVISYFALALSGLLLSQVHAFRWNDMAWSTGPWGFLAGTLGLLVFIPLALRVKTPGGRFLRGLWGGFWFFLATGYWVYLAVRNFGGLAPWQSVLVTAFPSFYCAIFLGIWSMIAGSVRVQEKSPLLRILIWASLWCSLEALRQWLFTGLPWGEIGYHFDYFRGLRETASIWGVHGLTFWWIFLVGVILHFDQIKPHRRQLIFAAGVFIAGVIVAQVDLFTRSFDRSARVSIIQPDISQDLKWDPQQATRNVETLLKLTAQGSEQESQLIIWPETAYPRLVSANQKQLPFATKTPLIMGAVVREGISNRNSALLVENDTITQRFDKVHLVPFGEYVPMKEWLPFDKLVANVGDFTPGHSNQPLLKIPSMDALAGPLICYEDIFSRSSVNLARQGAQLLLNMTNDAWYLRSSAQAQHASMAAFQVYQTFVPMIRSTNNGLSTFISPLSRTDVPNFTETVSTSEVAFASAPRKTFFVWTYPLMEWIWLFLFAIGFAWKRNPRTRRIFFQN